MHPTLRAVRTCGTCGTANPAEARFCFACGERFAVTHGPRRRFVVALFCDLVGSTELAEALDPEVLRSVLDRYFGSMRSAIERHGGMVEKFVGDAVVGTFGIPEAHEDDGLRAIRAALEMRDAATRIGAIEARPLTVRIAIAGGEAFADDLAPREGRVGGDVFNTAARLQAAGDPGEILVTAAVARLVRGGVRSEALPPVVVKGKALPVDAVRLLGLGPGSGRAPSQLVGRERALATLESAFEDALGRCVLRAGGTVLAPAGVGKSRLATAFVTGLGRRATVLVGQTPPYGEGVTFAPLLELLAGAAARTVSDGAAIAQALADRMAAEPDGEAVADRLAQLMGVARPS